MTDITQDRERIRAYLASLPAWKCRKLEHHSKVLFDTCTVLLAMVDGLSHKLEELDFLHHEGGPQSVAAMEEALRQIAGYRKPNYQTGSKTIQELKQIARKALGEATP